MLAAASAAGPGLRAVIIGHAAFSVRMDTTAAVMLVELRDDLALRGVELALAGKRTLIEQWRRGGFTDQIGDRPALRLFSTLRRRRRIADATSWRRGAGVSAEARVTPPVDTQSGPADDG